MFILVIHRSEHTELTTENCERRQTARPHRNSLNELPIQYTYITAIERHHRGNGVGLLDCKRTFQKVASNVKRCSCCCECKLQLENRDLPNVEQ